MVVVGGKGVGVATTASMTKAEGGNQVVLRMRNGRHEGVHCPAMIGCVHTQSVAHKTCT